MTHPATTARETSAIDPLGTENLDQRITAILSLTRQLQDLITSETMLLKSRRASSLRETQEEKTRLSSLYAREMRAIKTRPELLSGVSAAQKEKLRAASASFKKCIATHVRTLARIRAVSEGMVVAIGEELSRMRKPMTSYNGPSGPAMNWTSPVPHAPAFGIDRSI